MLRSLFLSASFLWRFPLKGFLATEKDFEKTFIFFPLIGFLEGLFLFILTYFLKPYLSVNLLSLLCLFFLFILRGIFHLDGLSDTFDALAFKGKEDKEEDKLKRLAIMKDSRTGVAGISAIFLALLNKFFCFKEILSELSCSLLIYPFLISRISLPLIIYLSKPAKKEGLGYFMKKSISLPSLLISLLLGFALLGFLLFIESFSYLKTISFILCINFIVLVYFKRKFERVFGGLTGDNFGAIVEISEGVILFVLVVLWPKV